MDQGSIGDNELSQGSRDRRVTKKNQEMNVISKRNGLLLTGNDKQKREDNLISKGNGLTLPSSGVEEEEECLASQRGRSLSEETPVNQLEQPYQPSCFLTGKVERLPVQILVDTGCTTNLLRESLTNYPLP